LSSGVICPITEGVRADTLLEKKPYMQMKTISVAIEVEGSHRTRTRQPEIIVIGHKRFSRPIRQSLMKPPLH
jgi:hypothetical protein